MNEQEQIPMRCEDCLWKTQPQGGTIVCLFPYCIYEKRKMSGGKYD